MQFHFQVSKCEFLFIYVFGDSSCIPNLRIYIFLEVPQSLSLRRSCLSYFHYSLLYLKIRQLLDLTFQPLVSLRLSDIFLIFVTLCCILNIFFISICSFSKFLHNQPAFSHSCHPILIPRVQVNLDPRKKSV